MEYTYVGYSPKNVVPSEPAETFRERKSFGEIELRATEFDEITERHHN